MMRNLDELDKVFERLEKLEDSAKQKEIQRSQQMTICACGALTVLMSLILLKKRGE